MIEVFRTEKDAYYLTEEDYQKDIEYIEKIFIRSPFTDVLNPVKYLKTVLAYAHKYDFTIPYALMIVYLNMPSEGVFEKVNINKTEGYVYLIHSEHGTKIGKSVRPIQRITQLQTQMPFNFRYIENTFVKDYSKTETELHKRFANKRLNGEWFNLSDNEIETCRSILNKLDFTLEKTAMRENAVSALILEGKQYNAIKEMF